MCRSHEAKPPPSHPEDPRTGLDTPGRHEKLGVSYDDVMRVLEDEGVAKFEASRNDLLGTIKKNMGL
jgi:transaldolase